MKFLLSVFFLLLSLPDYCAGKVYYCPMHPSYISDKPGECPICRMDLVLKEEEQKSDLSKHQHMDENINKKGIKISDNISGALGIKTEKIYKKEFIFKLIMPAIVIYEPELYKIMEEYRYNRALYEKISDEEKPRISEIIRSIIAKLNLKYGIDENIASILISDGYGGLITPDAVMFAVAYIDEKYIEIVKKPDRLKLFFESYSQKIDAKIIAISGIVDENRKIRIILEFKNINGLIRHNMYAEAEIEKNMGRKLLVPSESFIEYGDEDAIYVKSDGGYVMRMIKTGLSNDRYTEVLKGLDEGEEVVTSSNFIIDSETRLKGISNGHNH
ncbi:MAG: hypothetical protein Fur0012_11860 [Elusimicrobiota bacterium]